MPERQLSNPGLTARIMCASGVGAALLVSLRSPAGAGEVEISKIPANVRDTARRVSPKTKWSAAEKDRDDDLDVFELTGKDAQGRKVVVNISAAGKATELRTELPLKSVPKVVWKAVAEKLPAFEAITAYELREDDDLAGPEAGELSYEVSGTHAKDLQAILQITPVGEIAELEKQIPLSDVPKDAMAAVKAKLPMFQPETAFEMSEESEIVGYQLSGKRSKNKKAEEIDVFVSADGKDVEFDE